MFRLADSESGPAGQSSRGRRQTRLRWRLLLAGTVAAAALCTAVAPVAAAPKPPPNPTNAQLSAAAQQKAALAHTVGVLSAQIVQAQTLLNSLSAQAELAEQKFAFAVSKLNDAKEQATQAQTAVLAAQKSIDAARSNLTSYVRNSYMSPPVSSTTIGLLTASDPGALLQGGDYQHYVSAHHLDAIGALDRATVTKSNADAKARSLVQLQQQLTTEAAQAQQAAQTAYAQEKAQSAQLQAAQASYQQQLNAAQLQLATLNNQRATFLAYQRQQAAIAAAKARAAALARQRAAAAAAAAEAARQRASNSSNSGGGDQTSSYPIPSGPSGGSWTASKGRAAANKALSQLGVPYAWAGGGYYGRSRGTDSPGTDGWNDSNVIGFDCSGLAMFAWFPAIRMDHYALSQFSQAGSFHPQPGQFLPGDLLFWSDGGIGGIHHVAIYIGNGNVVQAPNSGDVVRVTPWNQVSYGYFGATRPLT
ncbi:MAG: NlpC/P60 family protein [Jatrophihabitans sp.]